MVRNKAVLRGVLIIAIVSLLAGLQLAGATPAKTSKSAQKAGKKATTRPEVVFSDATLTADQIQYGYDNGKLVPTQVCGHVILQVIGGQTAIFTLVATSQTAVFTPTHITKPTSSGLFLIDIQEDKKSAGPFDGTVTLKGNVQYKFYVSAHDSNWQRDCLTIDWLTCDTRNPGGSVQITTPTANGVQVLALSLVPDIRKKINAKPLRSP
jgi:hypothetical protein